MHGLELSTCAWCCCLGFPSLHVLSLAAWDCCQRLMTTQVMLPVPTDAFTEAAMRCWLHVLCRR